MTIEYLELGSTPCEENCTQVSGSKDYEKRAVAEVRAYVNQLKRLFPTPEGVYGNIRVKSFPHDFGTYYEAAVYFDSKDERSIEWAFTVESNAPLKWDDLAIEELRLAGYFDQ